MCGLFHESNALRWGNDVGLGMKDLAERSSEQWQELWSLLDQLQTIDPIKLVESRGGNRRDDGVIELPWNSYHSFVVQIEMLLYSLKAVQEDIGWSQWKSQVDPDLVFDAGRIMSGSMYDTVCLLTGIIRSERYGSGAIATSLRNGSFMTLLNHLRDLICNPPLDH